MGLEDLFYVRQGLGQNGIPIDVYKIRTMVLNAECDFEALAQENGVDGLGKIVGDPRITKLGKFLRRYGIDELPQIYNIIKGEMGLVGIRPRSEEDWAYFPKGLKEHALRYKPGWFTPAYSEVNVDSTKKLVEIEMSYLQQKDINAIRTDVIIFLRIIMNFVFRGVRSR